MAGRSDLTRGILLLGLLPQSSQFFIRLEDTLVILMSRTVITIEEGVLYYCEECSKTVFNVIKVGPGVIHTNLSILYHSNT